MGFLVFLFLLVVLRERLGDLLKLLVGQSDELDVGLLVIDLLLIVEQGKRVAILREQLVAGKCVIHRERSLGEYVGRLGGCKNVGFVLRKNVVI